MSPNQPPPLSSFLHIFPTMRNSTQDNESLNIIHIRTEVQVRGTKHAHMLIFNQFATPIEQKQAVKAYDGLMNSKVGRFGQLCVLKFNEVIVTNFFMDLLRNIFIESWIKHLIDNLEGGKND